MRYELTDEAWTDIKPMLPNKPRGIPNANGPGWLGLGRTQILRAKSKAK